MGRGVAPATPTAALTIAGPYQDADQALLDSVIFQCWYRQLGIVSINIGTGRVYPAARYLAANGRGGSLSWVSTGRVMQWNDVVVAPGLPDSPVVSMWLYGSAALQHNTVLTRKGFWSLDLFPAATSLRLRLAAAASGALSG